MNRREFLKLGLAAPLILKACKDPVRTALRDPGASSSMPPTEGIDVTAEWRALYARAAPGTEYRRGQVAASALKVLPVESKIAGYSMRLPAAHPIPTPAVHGGRVYVSGGFGSKQYFCLDAATGKQLWGVDLSDDGPSTAAIEDGYVVMNTESCTIFTLDAGTGEMAWSWWLGDPLMSSPTIAKGRVFSSYPANGRAHHREASHLLGCFELKTGKILWQRWIDGDAISAPVASGDEVVVATFSGTVFRFHQESGEARSVLKARATSAPVVVGEEMHFSRRAETQGSPQEGLCLWNNGSNRMEKQYQVRDAKYLDGHVQTATAYAATGKVLDSGNGFSGGAPSEANAGAAFGNVGQGSVSTLQGFQGSRILRYGDSNVACMGDEIVCNGARDGKKRWSVPFKGDLAKLGGSLAAPPVAAGRSLFVVGLDGRLIQLDPADGSRRRDWEIGHPVRYAPTVEAGRVFVGTQDGLLVCVDTGDTRNSGWPQWGRDAQRTGTYSPP
ncbi:MAG: PQQ-binding-like beta-propeller repeat protein [Planctomycetes bacterium]|nr:PQQ-binding-like beta-propeller repeat protein [Planctomycetota bacterium]